MPIITLTTDWNQHDYYTAILKGRLMSLVPQLTVVDISHRIDAYNYAQAAFVVRAAYPYFPAGTVHLIDVGSDASARTPHLVVQHQGQYFVGADNGLFSLLFVDGPETAVRIDSAQSALGSFQALTVFAPLAAQLCQGATPAQLGTPIASLTRSVPIMPIVEDNYISGHVLYIDSYYNAITNIDRQSFEQARRGRPFLIHVQSKQNEIDHISQNYYDDGPGELIALFNVLDLLEIAIVKGFAAELLNLDNTSTLRIVFHNE